MILLMRLFLRAEWSYYLFLLCLVFWLVSGASFGVKWYQTSHDNRAVILSEEENVLSGPDARDTVLFRVHGGTMVQFERSEEGWSLIRLPDKKRGWVKAGALERVRAFRGSKVQRFTG